MTKVAMIGCGKLGQDCAEVMAEHYDVVGYDVEPRSPAFPMCSTIQEAVSDRDLIFIAAPTPHAPVYGGETPTSHLPNQDFDYTIVMDILNEVNKYVNQNQLVILISTVLPGTVRNHLRPCITNARFIYNPYLIAMGTVKWDMVNPEMVIIGTEDGSVTGDAEELIDFYKPMMKNDPRYEVGTWDEAESIKIFYNTFISTKVALVNMIQDVSEANGNINVDVVTNALAKSTHRIMGPSYMTAGMGDGGACHPRDNIALRYLAERLNLGYDLFDAIMRAREVQAERLALRCLKNGKNITIIGKAYKPSVPYTNGSSSMLVGYYIEKHGGNVRYVDPNTGDFDPQTYWTDVYLIGYWEEYVKHFHFPPWCTIIDPWRKYERWVANIKYGDTRPTIKYVNETTTKKYENHFYSSDFPELEPFRDKIGYIEASCAELNAFHRIPAEELVDIIEKYLEQGKTKFIFDGRAEDFKDYIVVKIHKVIKLLGDKVKVSDFYYVLAATNWEKTYEKTKKLHGIDESINLLSHEHFLVFAKQQAENLKHPFEEYQIKTKKKKFLCFNKVCRNHRTLLLEHMFRENLVKDAYYSFFNFTPNYEVFFKNILENKNPKNDYFYALKNNKNLLPLRLNITEERNNPADVITDDLIYTEDSYFSVVTETVFDSQETMYVDLNGEKIELYSTSSDSFGNSIFLSEKAFKPIIMKHPFVMVSRSGTLTAMKNLGFKTFHPYINESYDNIRNDYERMLAIVDEIKRLCSFSDDQWLEWQRNIKDIVEYNYQHIKTMGLGVPRSIEILRMIRSIEGPRR